MTVVLITVLLLALGLLVLWLHVGSSRVQRRYHVAYERRLAELRLRQVTYAAMLRMLDEARRSR